MKVISRKRDSARERIDADAKLLPVPNWRFIEGQRYLLLSSAWNTGERNTELWLTEEEAFGIAKTVSETVLSNAIKATTAPKEK